MDEQNEVLENIVKLVSIPKESQEHINGAIEDIKTVLLEGEFHFST